MSDHPIIYCAIDTDDLAYALTVSKNIHKAGCGIKLGMQFFNALGPSGIESIKQNIPDLSLFIDLKYHDIPNTVAGAVKAIEKLEPDYINVHAFGGADMLKAASDARQSDKTRLLGVTVLTSMDDTSLKGVGVSDTAAPQVERLAKLTQSCGLDGVVCSAHEIKTLRTSIGKDFVLMVPGIRPAGSSADDQKRIMTPTDAMQAGATHLVIGRPITKADDPYKAALEINNTLADYKTPDVIATGTNG